MSANCTEGSFVGRLFSGRTLAAALIVGVATFFAAPATSKAVYEYDAALQGYYTYLYAIYAVQYEDVYPNDNNHEEGMRFAYYGYYYSGLGYSENDPTWFYYGYQYCGLAYRYLSAANDLYGGQYTFYAQQAALGGIAYNYIAYLN